MSKTKQEGEAMMVMAESKAEEAKIAIVEKILELAQEYTLIQTAQDVRDVRQALIGAKYKGKQEAGVQPSPPH